LERNLTLDPDLPIASTQEFRDGMRGYVGNCSIITVGSGDQANGLVLTSAISLSADPPLLLACINRSSSSWAALRESSCFGWSSLGARHQTLAERFSGFGGVKGAEKFDGAHWVTSVTGAQLLADAPTAFDCTIDEMIDRATHSILIGRVRATRRTPNAGALLYWNGKYLSLND
jgi:flavin reductase (DIM6/NTAB) family NADH-FMN oxidoreductase RutF